MRSLSALALLVALAGAAAADAAESATATLDVRGRSQTLHLYGPRGGAPVVVASGDGGWIHLAPVVADMLAARGRFVVGVDCKHYLSSFTSGATTLTPEQVPDDFRRFVEFARAGRDTKVLLAGVSEGAGLSVLAAADAPLRSTLSGIVALGLPNVNELGWRFRDQIIYITKRVPNEPTFRAADYIARLDGLPLAAIHSTRDEFVPLAEARKLLEPETPTRRLWVIDAADHAFSDATGVLDQRLAEALEWVEAARRSP